MRVVVVSHVTVDGVTANAAERDLLRRRHGIMSPCARRDRGPHVELVTFGDTRYGG
jgi:hypothetical protein